MLPGGTNERRTNDEQQWKIVLLSLWAVGRLSFAINWQMVNVDTANHIKRAKTKPVTTYVTKSVTKNVLDVKMLLFIVPSFKLGQAKL